MAYQGQVCCAGSRTYVHEDLYDKFVERAKQQASERVIADTFAEGCQHGPQVSVDAIICVRSSAAIYSGFHPKRVGKLVQVEI